MHEVGNGLPANPRGLIEINKTVYGPDYVPRACPKGYSELPLSSSKAWLLKLPWRALLMRCSWGYEGGDSAS